MSKDEEIASLKEALAAAERREQNRCCAGMGELRQRAEAAEARVRELERERDEARENETFHREHAEGYAKLVAQATTLYGPTEEQLNAEAQVAELRQLCIEANRCADIHGQQRDSYQAQVAALRAQVKALECHDAEYTQAYTEQSAQLAALRAEVERTAKQSAANFVRANTAESRLAAATELLARCLHGAGEVHGPIRAEINALLDSLAAQPATAPARDEAEQAVLAAFDETNEAIWRLVKRSPLAQRFPELALFADAAELARRGQ